MNFNTLKKMSHYALATSMVGFILTFLLANIAPIATISIITFGFVLISLSLMVVLRFGLNKKHQEIFISEYDELFTYSTIVLAAWSTIVNATYFEKINEGTVPNDFSNFHLWSMVTMAFQVITAFILLMKANTGINEPRQLNERFIKFVSFIRYILTAFNVVFLSIIHVAIKSFTTDG